MFYFSFFFIDLHQGHHFCMYKHVLDSKTYNSTAHSFHFLPIQSLSYYISHEILLAKDSKITALDLVKGSEKLMTSKRDSISTRTCRAGYQCFFSSRMFPTKSLVILIEIFVVLLFNQLDKVSITLVKILSSQMCLH